MSKSTVLLTLMLTGMTSIVGTAALYAEDEPSSAEEKVLADKGLTKKERKFLLDEAPALDKYKKTNTLYGEYQKAVSRLATIADYDETVENMQMEQQALQQQVVALQMQINSMDTQLGRLQRSTPALIAPLQQQQMEARVMINQINSQLQAAKRQAPKAEDRKAVPAQVEKLQQNYIDRIRELNELVAPLLTKYHELAHDKTVTEALDKLRQRTTTKYKLGPSEELIAASRLIQNVKKNTTGIIKSPAKKKSKSKSKAS